MLLGGVVFLFLFFGEHLLLGLGGEICYRFFALVVLVALFGRGKLCFKPEGRAFSLLRLHSESEAVLFENFLANGKSQTRAYNIPLVFGVAVIAVEYKGEKLF